jgi:hypothetical protein
MAIIIFYLLGIPVNYLIAKAAMKEANEGEWMGNDKMIAIITSILSFLGAAAWSLIYLAAKNIDGYDKPAKW